MALRAYERARELCGIDDEAPGRDFVGVACTAALATKRERKGRDRVWLALRSATNYRLSSLDFSNCSDDRSHDRHRQEEVLSCCFVSQLASESGVQIPAFDAPDWASLTHRDGACRRGPRGSLQWVRRSRRDGPPGRIPHRGRARRSSPAVRFVQSAARGPQRAGGGCGGQERAFCSTGDLHPQRRQAVTRIRRSHGQTEPPERTVPGADNRSSHLSRKGHPVSRDALRHRLRHGPCGSSTPPITTRASPR